MLKFHVSAVEQFTEFEVFVVHFDDEDSHYLALQVWVEGNEVEAHGFGKVHVEVDSELNAGYDCFTAAELRRDSFLMTFDPQEKEPVLRGNLEITFDLDDEAFAQLRDSLRRVFREFPAYRD